MNSGSHTLNILPLFIYRLPSQGQLVAERGSKFTQGHRLRARRDLCGNLVQSIYFTAEEMCVYVCVGAVQLGELLKVTEILSNLPLHSVRHSVSSRLTVLYFFP